MSKIPLLLLLPVVAAAQPKCWVEGVAVNKLTKAPIAGVKVRLTPVSQGQDRLETVTDGNGQYRIDGVRPGDYAAAFDAPHGFYAPDPIEQITKRPRVHVTDAGARFDIEVTPASTIRGRVLDADGELAAGVTVSAFPIGSVQFGMGRTNDKGQFAIPVRAGRYRLQARSAKDRSLRTYYPDTTDAATAEVVVVAEGTDAGGYDIRFPALTPRKIRGVLRDNAGEPVLSAEVVLSTTALMIEQVSRAKAGANGAFEFPSVTPGRWQISASASREGVAWFGKTVVTMANRDLDGVEVRLDPPFDWDVGLEGVPEERRKPVHVELLAVEGVRRDYAMLAEDQPPLFHAIYPGTYRVSVDGRMPGYYVQSVWTGAMEVSARQVEVGPASPPLRVVYAAGGGRIAGEVEDGAAAQVVLVWADRASSIMGQDIFSLACDRAGRFGMSDLRPGDWYVLAVPGGRLLSNDTIREAIFDRGLWRQAEAVHVGESQTTDARLKVSPWLE